MSKHIVSVIIPCYNSEKWIESAVESCLIQGNYIKEIIIIDDHSTDNSWNILVSLKERHENIVIARNPLKGGNNARNHGFSISSGEFVQWLDSDDVMLPGKLDAQVLFMEQNPSVDIVYSDWRIETYNEHNVLIKSEYKPSKNYDDYLKELLIDNWIAPHVYLLRSDIVKKTISINGWNASTRVAQDREFFTKAALAGAKFGYIKETVAVYNRRLNTKSVSRSMSDKDKARNIIQLLEDFIDLIKQQDWISKVDERIYKKILKTQILYYLSIYNIDGIGKSFLFKDIDWKLIKGYRSRLKMLKRLFTKR